jgi:hypothetical protein
MVLAATAIPIELRGPTYNIAPLTLSLDVIADVLVNIILYVPVGIVLCECGPLRAFAIAAGLAVLAETGQLVMAHRDPSIHDVISNLAGTVLGMAIASRWKVRLPLFTVSRRKSQIAALTASVIVVVLWLTSPHPPNARGINSPGTLEGQWKLDEVSGRIARDWSGGGLDGKFNSEPSRVDGTVMFDGARDRVDIGHPRALRLVGSMTVSAWIKPASYPFDDAAIVSSFTNAAAGYQLDVTPDTGPRTISLKIANECGQLVVRYGATTLPTDHHYHVAGVYNAEARTLDVYLNGKLDNGLLFGSVTGRQHSSRLPVYIGRRSDGTGFEFAGLIHDVRIYSRALKAVEIASDMLSHTTGTAVGDDLAREKAYAPQSQEDEWVHASCTILSDAEDRHIPIAAAAVGVLVAVAAMGLWPNGTALVWLLISVAVGALLPSSTLPPINFWLIPLTSLGAGASAIGSLRRSARLE